MFYDFEESGRRVANLRMQHGYTQEQLADVLNMDRSVLSKAEAGKRGLPIEIYVQIADLFFVSLDYLITGKNHRQNEVHLKENVGNLISLLEVFREQLDT
ncbi:MAG: helix-turn-helix domain-containing protein [Clostridiales bacterium]|nr:helix-turn-helix domain-containing protein [Clostridiales bacterium]